MILQDLKRSIFNLRFWLAVLVLFVAYFFQIYTGVKEGVLHNPDFYTEPVTLTSVALEYSYIALVIPSLAAVGYGLCFCRDYRSGYLQLQCARVSVERYVASKALAAMFSGGLINMLSAFIIMGILHAVYPLRFPLVEWDYIQQMMRGMNRVLFEGGHIGLYFFGMGTSMMLYGALWSMVALAISTWIPNAFLVLVMPMAICRVTVLTEVWLDLPVWTNLALFNGNGIYDGVWPNLTVCAAVYGTLILLCLWAFWFGVRRRLHHG